jgi:hypothetical protein
MKNLKGWPFQDQPFASVNVFFPEVIIGIREVLKRENYQLLIMQLSATATRLILL